MRDKVCTAAEAMRVIRDRDVIAFHFWGFVGAPAYLLRAFVEHGSKDITLYVNNFVALPSFLAGFGFPDLTTLLPQVRKIITPFIGSRAFSNTIGDFLGDRVQKGQLELESTTHGTFVERLHAGAMGLGGFYSPVGVDTVVAQGKEIRNINNQDYIFEKPVCPDVGLIKADKADKAGNLVYRGSAKGVNPLIAMASKITIVEVFDVVEIGELDPEAIVTPGIFVDHIVRIPEDDPCSNRERQQKLKMLIKSTLASAPPPVQKPGAVQ